MRDIRKLIVHCAATRPEWRAGSHVADKVAEIRRWHVDGNGWDDIAYHWVIDRDGSVAKGRPEAQQGAHARGHNADSIGICLIGGHGAQATDNFADHFTPEQDAALRELLSDLQSRFPGAKVLGHNQLSRKGCPGFNAPRWWAKKPERAAMASTTLQATAGGAVATVGGVLGAVGKLDPTAQLALVAGAVVVLGAFAWIARERIRKWAAGDR